MVIIYFNNILIFLVDKSQYKIYIKEILKLRRNTKLYIKLLKYQFNIIKIEFLNFIISLERI